MSRNYLDYNRLRSAQRLMDEVASQMPPFSPEQIHALVKSGRLTQLQLRRQADRYLLILCLFVLALAASVLWHTAPAGATLFNIAVSILAFADLWVALRAARSLWLMGQTRRLRSHPYRMSRYADRLNRLTHRRRMWLGLVLRDSYNSVTGKDYRRQEFFSIRLPSYTIAACLFLLIAVNADKAFAATHDFDKVTTTSGKSDTAIRDAVNYLLSH